MLKIIQNDILILASSNIQGNNPGPVLGLVFLLSALLVFLYVILVWLLIMRALLGKCGGTKDLEAQRIFV